MSALWWVWWDLWALWDLWDLRAQWDLWSNGIFGPSSSEICDPSGICGPGGICGPSGPPQFWEDSQGCATVSVSQSATLSGPQLADETVELTIWLEMRILCSFNWRGGCSHQVNLKYMQGQLLSVVASLLLFTHRLHGDSPSFERKCSFNIFLFCQYQSQNLAKPNERVQRLFFLVSKHLSPESKICWICKCAGFCFRMNRTVRQWHRWAVNTGQKRCLKQLQLLKNKCNF